MDTSSSGTCSGGVNLNRYWNFVAFPYFIFVLGFAIYIICTSAGATLSPGDYFKYVSDLNTKKRTGAAANAKANVK